MITEFLCFIFRDRPKLDCGLKVFSSNKTFIICHKVQDAYEEVEEQRAVAAQWKRKLQKLTNDMADLRSLLDEQVGTF